MIEAYQKYLINYINFKGCTSRRDYWYVFLFNIIIGMIIFILAELTGVEQISYLSFIYELATIIPSISISIRRLHDTNKSGWYYLLILVPFIGTILLLVFMCLDREEPNNYGERI